MYIDAAMTTHDWPVEMWETVVREATGEPVAVALGLTQDESQNRARLIANKLSAEFKEEL